MKLSDLQGRRVVLWGAGRETTSLVRSLVRNGIEIDLLATLIDEPTNSYAERELSLHAPLVPAANARKLLDAAEVIVRSPVVQPMRREIRMQAERGATVTTATALWIAEHPELPMIGVTGSKGKTTTTALIGHLLASQGLTVEVAGNIGRPVTDIESTDSLDHVVLELSSFQLTELTRAPATSVFTNFLREHDNWHRGTENYLEAKLNMCRRPGAENFVARACDRVYSAAESPAKLHLFGDAGDYTVEGDAIRCNGVEILTADDFPLPGTHNLLNSAAALTAVSAAGHQVADVHASLAGFEPPSRRLAFVAEQDDVRWIDDIHSSAPESAVAAARAFDGPVTLIVGGRLRGQDHGLLVDELIANPELALVLFESGGETIHADALTAGVASSRLHLRQSLSAALDTADRVTPRPSTVVLSPIGLMEVPTSPVIIRSELLRDFVVGLGVRLPSQAAMPAMPVESLA